MNLLRLKCGKINMTTHLEDAAKILAGSISDLHIDPAEMKMIAQTLADAISSLKNEPTCLDWITTISSAIVVACVLIGIIKIWMEFKGQKKQYIKAQNDNEKERISTQLNDFFAPLVVLRSESQTLYEYFAVEEKKLCIERNEKRFRTLRHLTQGKPLEESDQAILLDIIDIGKKKLCLIENRGYLLRRNSAMSDLLGLYGAHIRALIKANDGKLVGLDKIFESLCFPKELDGAICSEILRLQDEYKASDEVELASKTSRIKKSFSSFIKPRFKTKHQKTIDHYSKNAQEYFFNTGHIDMSELYEMFLSKLKFGDLILDAGCGTGRDTKHFIQEGYRVVSFDACKEMVDMCNQYSFAYCRHETFESIKYIEEFNGVWACASLIHLSKNDLKSAFRRLYNATKSDGLIYFSLKQDERDHDGKITYFHDKDKVDNFLRHDLNLQTEIEIWENPSKKANDTSRWANFLYRKVV